LEISRTWRIAVVKLEKENQEKPHDGAGPSGRRRTLIEPKASEAQASSLILTAASALTTRSFRVNAIYRDTLVGNKKSTPKQDQPEEGYNCTKEERQSFTSAAIACSSAAHASNIESQVLSKGELVKNSTDNRQQIDKVKANAKKKAKESKSRSEENGE
jgi:hypothetical protein